MSEGSYSSQLNAKRSRFGGSLEVVQPLQLILCVLTPAKSTYEDSCCAPRLYLLQK